MLHPIDSPHAVSRLRTARLARSPKPFSAPGGWLEPFGAIRYANYDSPRDNDEEPIEAADDEARWRSSTLSRVLVMLLAHARSSGVDQARFFKEAHETLNHMEKGWGNHGGAVEERARRVAETAVRDLLDGPEYPTTSLLLK